MHEERFIDQTVPSKLVFFESYTPTFFSGKLIKMAKVKRHSFFTDYRKKHNVPKGYKVCESAREFDRFKRPGVTLTGAQRCHS